MCSRFLLILIGVMLIAGCREGGGDGGSGFWGGYQSSSGSSSGGSSYASSYQSSSSSGGSGSSVASSMNPEPSTIALFGTGLVGLAYSMFGRKKR